MQGLILFLFILLKLSVSKDVPQPFTLLDFKSGCTFINLTWNPASGYTGMGKVRWYHVAIKAASSEGPWTTKSVSQSTHSCLFTHLKPNSEYHVRVMAMFGASVWPTEVSKVSTIHAGDLRRKFVKCDPIRPTDSRSYDCLSKFNLISWVVHNPRN